MGCGVLLYQQLNGEGEHEALTQSLKQLLRVSSSAGSPYKVEFSRGRSGTSRRCCSPI